MSRFNYLIEKINDAKFVEAPFKHLYIEDFFSPDDFQAITRSPQISLPSLSDDQELFQSLFSRGYKVVDFPGCITDVSEYCRWHKTKNLDRRIRSSCEGFGIVLRLIEFQDSTLDELSRFLVSKEFNSCIALKNGINIEGCTIDGGIQKYMDGYEISPHPDIRKKAATYMVNINDGQISESRDHHTHYLKFKQNRRYVEAYWDGNPDAERCWVPWDWCETAFQQTKNNSIVVFFPDNDTMHAVKASYDHLLGQRTQLYGNLWYKKIHISRRDSWEDLDLINCRAPQSHWTGLASKLKRKLKAARRKFFSSSETQSNYHRRQY